ncbi:hypothetical protein FOZ63_006350, partial [Perkinsus olseni]
CAGCLLGRYEFFYDGTDLNPPVTDLDFNFTPEGDCMVTFNLHKDNAERARFSAGYGIVKHPDYHIEDLVLRSVDPIPAAYKPDFEAYSTDLTLTVLLVVKSSNMIGIAFSSSSHWISLKNRYLSSYRPPGLGESFEIEVMGGAKRENQFLQRQLGILLAVKAVKGLQSLTQQKYEENNLSKMVTLLSGAIQQQEGPKRGMQVDGRNADLKLE